MTTVARFAVLAGWALGAWGAGCGKPDDGAITDHAREEISDYWKTSCGGSPGKVVDVWVESRQAFPEYPGCKAEAEVVRVVARGRCPSGTPVCTEATYLLCKGLLSWDYGPGRKDLCSSW